MTSIEQILKDNGQNPNQANQTGTFEFSKKAGCLVYQPLGINSPRRCNFKVTQISKN